MHATTGRPRRTRALTIATALLFISATAACGSRGADDPLASLAAPTDAEGISGVVTLRDEGGRLKVEENPAEPTGSAKAVVSVAGARVYRRADGAQITASAIQVGDRVTVWFTGPVRESYPVQAQAGVIAVEPSP